MTIPGFTAEASLYRTTQSYRMVGASIATAGDSTVVPQVAPLLVWAVIALFALAVAAGPAAELAELKERIEKKP